MTPNDVFAESFGDEVGTELLKVISKVIKVPERLIRLELSMGVNEAAVITYTVCGDLHDTEQP